MINPSVPEKSKDFLVDEKRLKKEGSVPISELSDESKDSDDGSFSDEGEPQDESKDSDDGSFSDEGEPQELDYAEFEEEVNKVRYVNECIDPRRVSSVKDDNSLVKNNKVLCVSCVIVIICILLYWLLNGGEAQKLTKVQELNKNLLNLKQSFKNQENILWSTVLKQIKYVNESNPPRPAILMLLHNNSELTTDCLSWQIAQAASKFFNKDMFIEIIGDNLNYKDNELVKLYKEPLKQKVVMLVHKLHKITPSVAKSFHTFCDYYTPLVKRAVILFTFDESGLLNNNNNGAIHEKPAKRVNKMMKSLWAGQLMDSTLTPLITRLTEVVIEVKPEEKISCPKE